MRIYSQAQRKLCGLSLISLGSADRPSCALESARARRKSQPREETIEFGFLRSIPGFTLISQHMHRRVDVTEHRHSSHTILKPGENVVTDLDRWRLD